MDPTVAWWNAVEGDMEAAGALLEWLLTGGFPPKGKTREETLLWLYLTCGLGGEDPEVQGIAAAHEGEV